MARNPISQIIITAKDEASAVFSGLRNHVGKIAAAIAGFFGAKLFGDAVESARGFESAMSAVQAAAGASADELALLRTAAEQAGATTKFTSIEAAAALENLAKAGLSATDAVQALPAVLNLAQAGGVELATASEVVTKAVSGMGLSFSEAGRVADVLAMGANASLTSVEGLAAALSFAAPVAQSLGLSLEQTVAIIGKFADAGIDASRAGTALNSILSQFSNPASKFREELAAAGITTGDFDAALRQLAAAGPAGQKAIVAVGQEAGPALRALLNQGIGSLDALKAKLDESAGSAATFAKVMGDNLDGATKGFGSAWDALLIKIGSPVLETLKNQVNSVADRLREFVANGTAERFGEAIKSAFEAGGKWAADFFSKIDFTALAASMQGFAARAGEVFDWIGEKASAAGNTVQLVYGVMSAGVNTVLTAVYKLGEGMSWLTSAFLSDLADISAGIAKVTFGDLSKGFAEAAAKLKLEAQAAYAVSQEFGRKSGEAFAGIVAGTASAAEGWNGLTTSSATSSTAIAADLKVVQQQATLTADQLDAIGESGQFIAGAVTKAGEAAVASSAAQQQAAAAAQVKVAELRAEYERFIKAGDTQRAAEVLVELRTELAKTSAQATITANDVSAAFTELGITSQAALQESADKAARAYATLKASGQATARDLEAAFRVYAERAIAANNGVADSTLKAEAAQLGLKIEADESGKVIVRSMSEAAAAIDALSAKTTEAADGIALIKRQASGLEGVWDADGNLIEQKNVRNASGGGITSYTERGAFEKAKSEGLDDAAALKLAAEFANTNRLIEFQQAIDSAVLAAARRASRTDSASRPPSPASDPSSPPTVHRVEVKLGERVTRIDTASGGDARALAGLLQQLEDAAARS